MTTTDDYADQPLAYVLRVDGVEDSRYTPTPFDKDDDELEVQRNLAVARLLELQAASREPEAWLISTEQLADIDAGRLTFDALPYGRLITRNDPIFDRPENTVPPLTTGSTTMTTTEPAFTASESDTIDRILAGVTKLSRAVDALNAVVAESNRQAAEFNRQAARDARERRRAAIAPVAPPRPPSMNPVFLLVIGASLLIWVGTSLHMLGVV